MNGLWPWEWDWRGIWDNISETVEDIGRVIGNVLEFQLYAPFHFAIDPLFGLQMFPAAIHGEFGRYYSYNHWLLEYGFSGRADLLDAHRHFTWMFNETRMQNANRPGFGPSRARFIGDQNELMFLDSMFYSYTRNHMLAMFDMDTIMDLWNNSVGIEYASLQKFEGMNADTVFWYLAAPYFNHNTPGVVNQSDNPILILHENHVAGILEIYLNDDREILGEWDLRSNSLRLTDRNGVTTLCLFTREHTRTDIESPFWER